jgi:hypothetical protein
MITSNKLSSFLLKICLTGCAAIVASTPSMAQDSERIKQLEKEVQDIKMRLANLEAPGKSSDIPKIVLTDKYKNIANWRMLKKGMSFDEVRALLGEPIRINGGTITYWFYTNQPTIARATFYRDKLDDWSEP